MQQRTDSIPLDSTYFTAEGYLIDTPIVTTIGVFDYKNADGSPRRELRLPTHVFNPKSLATYEGKPIIITHDAGWITEDNLNQEIVGTMLTTGTVDGDNVRAKIVIHEIDKVKNSGLRELSLGYKLNLIEESGEYMGEPYDAIQTDIQINHLALVGEARAGETARLNLDKKDQKDGNTATPNILKGAKNMKRPKKFKDLFKRTDSKMKRRKDSETGEILEDSAEEVADGTEETAEDTDLETADDTEKTATDEDDITDRLQQLLDRKDKRADEDLPTDLETALEYITALDAELEELIDIAQELKAAYDYKVAEDPPAADEYEDEDEEENSDEDEESEAEDRKDGKTKKKRRAGRADSVDLNPKIEHAVRERLKLVRTAERLNLDQAEDMTPQQLKLGIIRKVNPGLRLDGKNKHYIDAAFNLALDTLKKDKSTNRQKTAIYGNGQRTDGTNFGKSSSAAAREKMEKKMLNGGKK
ncbi:MAG: DUF2213 domain-containing protein [Turicibacter sp.]|nr:DUF2213 domain-containing protein [Turicibacter sp.]